MRNKKLKKTRTFSVGDGFRRSDLSAICCILIHVAGVQWSVKGATCDRGLSIPTLLSLVRDLALVGDPLKTSQQQSSHWVCTTFFLACSVSYRVSLLFEQEAQFFSWWVACNGGPSVSLGRGGGGCHDRCMQIKNHSNICDKKPSGFHPLFLGPKKNSVVVDSN